MVTAEAVLHADAARPVVGRGTRPAQRECDGAGDRSRPVRDAEIIETRGPDGWPPFLVRWADDGRTTLVFPGPDARVHSLARTES